LVQKKNAICEGSNLDAERLKRNVSYAIRSNCKEKEVSVLKNAVEAVLEHHFGNHSKCGDWCLVKPLEGKELEEAKLNYRCKTKNALFYSQVKKIFEEFYEQLEEMLHCWDTNIVEGMNKFFTKFLPKDRTYAMTIENKVRIHLAVAIDSVGYTEVYQRLAKKTGLTYCAIQREMNRQFDNDKTYRREYRKKKKNKIRRMRKHYAKLAKGKLKLTEENRKSLQYSTGMSGPFKADGVEQGGLTGKRKRDHKKNMKNTKVCSKCKQVGHSRRSSNLCLQNPKRLLAEAAAKKVAAAQIEEIIPANEAREKGTTFGCVCSFFFSWY
jgi:hypothetical protein